MNLNLKRFSSGDESTIGMLKVNGIFHCFTIEDEYRDEKVAGETRIPAGIYPVALRCEGTMTKKYEKFPEHRGMLWLQDVPNFTYVYIHIGNTDADTNGCILVAEGVMADRKGGGRGLSSTPAYLDLYALILQAMDNGEKVYINIED
jgi:hypothetical protein